jgi:uncharacterized protein (UPF0335 family)
MSSVFDENDNPDDVADRERGRNETDEIDLTHLSPELRDLVRSTMHRVEDLEAQRKELADDVKDLLAGAKLKGVDPKTIRTIIKLRKMDPKKREREEQLLELYLGVFA